MNIEDNHIDDYVDEEIKRCIDNKRCFFMFAGAGSGKTRSLVNLLDYIKKNYKEKLFISFKSVAVITYTNVACDEILDRVEYDNIFQVKTIHSFLWSLIQNLQIDIKKWVEEEIKEEINKLADKIKKAKKLDTAKKYNDKMNEIRQKLEKIKKIKKFSYNPNGQNLEYNSLSHIEVLKMGCQFLKEKKTMQNILISKYPIILIDESQDTKKELIDALMEVYKNNKNVIIGMFGDQMQRIYPDGKENMEEIIPEEWIKPIKVMNHRSAKRIVQLANKIRRKVDSKEQRFRSDAKEGIIRLFICDNRLNRYEIESNIANKMVELAHDNEWKKDYEILILEHHMAAERLGFGKFFNTLYQIEEFRTGILDGNLIEISFFTKIILPLIEAHNNQEKFIEMKILREKSTLINEQNISIGMNKLRTATNALYQLCNKEQEPSLLDILENINKNNLFEIPTKLKQVLEDIEEETDKNQNIKLLREALKQPLSELKRYEEYISGNSYFATQQGIKGLEFPRVMVIIDDNNSKGFLFSYEKLFGVKEKSDSDIKNEIDKKDTSIDRTNRLFYVACTRAKESLAIVAYTEDVEKLRNNVIENEWFTEDEIDIIK